MSAGEGCHIPVWGPGGMVTYGNVSWSGNQAAVSSRIT